MIPSAAAKIIYDYLARSSPLPLKPVDAIVGFGHFDLRIAHHCAQLWLARVAPRIIFAGGVGAGSADLGLPEANAFANLLQREYPMIPPAAILLESQSTNTGENVRNLVELARHANWSLDHVLLVATPFRQRRVQLTWQAQGVPQSRGISAPVPSSLATDIDLFTMKNEDLVAQLPGEIERLLSYAEREWIAPAHLPFSVIEAHKVLTD